MFAITFDLDIDETTIHHPSGLRQAYREIERTLKRYEFFRVQQSVFMTELEDLANLTSAMTALKAMPWFGNSVKDIRAFRVEQWSDFTPFMKSNR
ncbi:virulence factor [Brevundimonas subvibrioides]|uniref:virulence factor n=1 Tax=Brevundimonas subvibrioides TaxID=74313 RepID=UPI0022B5CED4|nr:virulence factor [Brevundimonas subvibrioides]